jgi:hypothetical protein
LQAIDWDKKYGVPRLPERVDKWEAGRSPASLSNLDSGVASDLAAVEKLAQTPLFRHSERAKNYIWAMAVDGSIKIAVEELAPDPVMSDGAGYPRRRGYAHPSEEKKLGHPTLLGGAEARIAGELAFDEFDGELRWVFNVNSGRYCRQQPPSAEQIASAADLFRNLGLDIFVDDLL